MSLACFACWVVCLFVCLFVCWERQDLVGVVDRNSFSSSLDFGCGMRKRTKMLKQQFSASLSLRSSSNGRRVRPPGVSIKVVLLCLLLRVGEARVPGPDDNQDQWKIGVCNPAGLNDKCHLIAHGLPDLWVVAETHLSAAGVRKFRQGLEEEKSDYRWCCTGRPVPTRSTASAVGTWSGVAIVAKHPTKSLNHVWKPEPFATSRLLCTTSFIKDFWVSGVALYGTPSGPTHAQAKSVTNQLVSEAVGVLKQMDGPRFLGGDFNHDLQRLDAVSELLALGFVEVQDLWFEKMGIPPKATCRMKTRRDFLFVSPELVPWVSNVEVDHNVWVDHATLVATIQCNKSSFARYPWTFPQPIPWKKVPHSSPSPCPFVDHSQDCSEKYQQFWNSVENRAACALATRGITLDKRAFGRAKCTMPRKCTDMVGPVVEGRRGEIVPQFFGMSFLHKQWFKQARRLQSFVRLAGAPKWSTQHTEHLSSLWRSILQAHGFKPDFASWWVSRDKAVGEMSYLPLAPPSRDVALEIFRAMEWEVRQLEGRLRSSRSCDGKRKSASLQQLFREVKRDAPQSVDVLMQTQVAQIVEIDSSDASLVLDRPVQFDPSKPIISNGHVLQLEVITPDQLWVADVAELEKVQPGSAVIQRRTTGRLTDIFQAFVDQWESRWGRHRNVPLSHWETIIEFARHRLVGAQDNGIKITVPLVRSVARSKKHCAAIGLDGVSRQDLLHLDSNQMSSVVEIYHHAQHGGNWPRQLLQGAVKSLAKKVDPEGVADYRPITILPFCYRVWSSIQSRHWLHALTSRLDPFLCGNRPGFQAATLWRTVLEFVELSQGSTTGQCGIVFDLEKAFNTIPRLPVMALAKIAGVEHSVLIAWSAALSGLERRFVVQGSYSPSCVSWCGFPEGCGLSCLAMLLVDQVWALWVKSSCALAQPLSFVDNWEILVSSPAMAAQAVEATLRFAQALDLTVDQRKSFAWGTDRETRQGLRNHGLQVKLSDRDLGAHIVFSRQIRNATCIQRFASLADCWDKLQGVSGSFGAKRAVITVAAWPRALHAIGGTFVGVKHFHQLRVCYMKALGLSKPGANARVQFVLDSAGGDPQFRALIASVRDFRDLCSLQSIGLLESVVQDPDLLAVSSVHQVLASRLHWVGIEIGLDGWIRDAFGWVHLLDSNWTSLEVRLQWAWEKLVATSVSHRSDFSDFHRVDIGATRRALASLSAYEQGIMRRHLNGTTCTNEHAFHWSEDGNHCCVACGEPDSLDHRLWQCCHSGDLRIGLSSQVLDLVACLPHVVTCRGWFVRSCLHDQWVQYCLSLPSTCPPAAFQLDRLQPVDLFTDGSCLQPGSSAYRLAAWSVCAAGPCSVGYGPESCRVLAASPLDGLTQTAFRAELKAVAVALSYGRQWSGDAPIRIWVDCQGVVDKFLMLVSGQRSLRRSGPNADLWREVLDAVADIGRDKIVVAKVAAHVVVSDELSELERWLAINNGCADRAAGQANIERPDSVWRLWEHHVRQVEGVQHVMDALWRHQLAVSVRWTEFYTQATPSVQPKEVRQAKVFPQGFRQSFGVVMAPDDMVRILGRSFSHLLLTWWNEILDLRDGVDLQWVSFIHLYTSFQLSQKHPGLVRVGRKWVDPQISGLVLPEVQRGQARVKAFRLAVQQMWKCIGCHAKTATTRVNSAKVVGHFGACSIPMKSEEWGKAEKWLSHNLKEPLKSSGRVLANLPLV